MAGVVRTSICDLRVNEQNAMIIAIIIGKQEPRKFAAWKGQGEERGVWSFTVRDSAVDTINVTVWGSEMFVNTLARSFNIGDVVVISGPRVSFRIETDDTFAPSVSSELSLSLNETHSKMHMHEEAQEAEQFQHLMHVPTKTTTNFLTLADVERKGESTPADGKQEKCVVDLLVAVNKVCNARTIRRKKDGVLIQCCEILLMDYTVSAMPMVLWNVDLINRAKLWRPGHTVLFIADAMVEKKEWNNRMVVSVGMRTIITEDPVCSEADMMRKFASQVPLQLVDQLDQINANITNPKSINTVMTIQQVRDILEQENANFSREVYALVYCAPVFLDLDGVTRVLATRCLQCSQLVDNRVGICEQCELKEAGQYSSTFDIRVTLADHTGSLSGIRLSGLTAENVLKISANDFHQLPSEQRTVLKWRFLLERCAVRLVIVQGGYELSRPVVSIIECERVDSREAAARIPAN